MKKWSRLTALVLAFAIVLSTVSGALAQIEIDHGEFQTWVADTKEAEGLSGVISIDEGGEVLVAPSTFTGELNQGPLYTSESTRNLSAYAQGSAPTVDVALGQYSKVELAAPSAGQWQVYLSAADLWVNITGETGSTFALTYAKVKGMIDADGAAKIRCLMGENATETVSVTVRYEDAAVVVNSTATVSQPMVMSARTVAAGTTKEGEDTTTYTVSIVYLFEDGTSAASSYVAQVGKGTSYDKVVPNPVVVGYDAYVNNVKADSVTLDYSDIQENKEVFVYYKPANVGFTVIHYQQNVGNDEYTEFARETKPGFTKAEVGSGLEKNYNGFQALLYDTTVKIAADGTTYVEIYYDRNYYLVNFVLNGGYGVEPIYARYGAPISIEEPTRLGYTFNGWSPAVPATVPYGGGEYTAQWTAGGAKYTVIYWAENANDNNYSYWGNAEKTANAGDLVSGTDDFNGTTDLPKAGFHFSHADQNKVVEGDGSTIVNVYYKRNTYTLIFAYEGGDLICDTHVHTDDCYALTCTREQHTHSYDERTLGWNGFTYYGGCYPENGGTSTICGKEEHTHRRSNYNSCYSSTPSCGQTASNNHSHSVANGCYGMKFENIKYGADTSEYWAQAPAYKWKVTYSGTTFYTAAPAMPNSNLIIYGTSQSGSSVIHYYEKVNGQETTNKVRPDYTVNTDGWSFTSEDYIDIPGFTYSSSRNNNAGTQYYIYYTRNSYNLTFQNGSETTSGGTHLYEADISDTYFVPEYTGDEAEAYEFGGWYTTEGCLKGTEFEFKGATMPYNHLILYAKWVPVTHTVDVYLTDAKTEQLSTEEVSHRAFAAEPEQPTNGNYTFAGWFYMDNGEEKAFSFASMPIIQDMEIYAKWSSNKLMEYVIHYELEDGTTIAPDTTGSALAGSTKTFEAKTGDALNAGYQAGYYPKVSSHSITIDIDDASKNEFTFVYVQMPKVPYTVRYLEEGTNKVLYTEKNTETNMAVVTENFVVVTGYRPDAYQKRLVLSADTAQNVITFWYVVDKEHAPVMITHYTQNIVGDGYSEYQSSTDLNAVIGNTYSEGYLTIPGFVKNTTVEGTLTSGTLTAEGLHLKLYYDRIEYPYEFNFLLYGTTTKLAGSETGNARYGATVNQTAKSIDGYKLVSDSAQSIVIAIEDPANVANKNVKNFFYVEDDIPLHYEVVGPTGSGTVVPAEETVKAVTGEAIGSTATAAANYVFEGWYKDAACSQPVDKAWVDENNKIVPVKEGSIWTETTYYAKFVEQQVTINYVAVGPTGSGTVDPAEETVTAVTGEANGSTATAAANYVFDGWYKDADCSQPVDGAWVDENNKIVPVKEGSIWTETTYYAKFVEQQVTINYVAVGPTGSGTVDPAEETVKAVTGEAIGSTATAAANYVFDGWYKDADCSQPVDGAWVDENNKIVPVKEGSIWTETTYYAKFVEQQVTINYVAVGPTGSGTVDPAEETVKAVTGEAIGSTATAAANYVFDGWYKDADCSQPVDGTWVDENNKIVPVKEGSIWTETTYYAKFIEDKVTIEYKPVFEGQVLTDAQRETIGDVDPYEETINVVTGEAQGSEATAASNTYKFVGWFTEPECTNKVSDAAEFKPTKPTNATEDTSDDVWAAAIYYAKFEYNVGKLKVTKQASAQTTNDTVPENAEFTFTLGGVEWDSVEYPYTVYNKGENADTVASNGELTSSNKTFTLKNEQYVIIENLLHGANATVKETNSDEYYTTWDSTKVANLTADDSLSGTATIQAGNTVGLTCYNVYRAQVGNLTINKTLQDSTFTAESLEKLQLTFTVKTNKDLSKWSINPAGALVDTDNKTITYVMTLENGAHSGVVTFQNLPIGDYTVTESAIALTKDGTALTYKTYTKSIADDGAAVKVEKGKTAEVEVINTASGTIAELPVTKAWVDNEYVKYRSAVTMHLNATVTDGTTPVYTDIVLDGIDDDVEAEAWTGKWTNLPMFDTKGNKIIYTVSEVAAPVHYLMTKTEVDNSGWTVTNTINVGKLVITKSGMQDGESAIFKVQLADEEIQVVLTGPNASVVIGEIENGTSYSVTEDGNWTALYSQTSSSNTSGSIKAGEIATASFVNEKKDQWLHDESAEKNVYKTIPASTANN